MGLKKTSLPTFWIFLVFLTLMGFGNAAESENLELSKQGMPVSSPKAGEARPIADRDAFTSSSQQSFGNSMATDLNHPGQVVTWSEAFDRHASLAFFSLGSLAVGGILVGIRSENQAKLNYQSHAGNRDVAWGLGMAGLTSLIAGGAFWYYSRQEMSANSDLIPEAFSLKPQWNSGFGIAAEWRIRFPSFFL